MFSLYYNNSTYLPITNSFHASMCFPTRAKLFANNLLTTPRTIGVDGIMSYGGGTGVGLDLPKKSFGEYFERNHFFLNVPVTSTEKLKNILPLTLQNALAKCMNQIKNSKNDPLEHSFHLTKVHNLMNHELADYPFNAISLNGKKPDGGFYNFNDSCSCAAHTSKEAVLRSSLCEFLERQALVGSWTSRQVRFAIEPTVLLHATPYATLAEQLLNHGELYIFENNIGLPGYSTIIFYFAKSENDLVQYSVGSSAGFSLEESLNGSFEELWQCYLFQYNAENSKGLADRAGSAYHLSFQACNHPQIRETIPFLSAQYKTEMRIKNTADMQKLPQYQFKDIVIELSNITSEIYYYHHFDKCLGFHYAKLVSPEFFIHMSLEQRLNFDNAYAKRIGLVKETANLSKIPFP